MNETNSNDLLGALPDRETAREHFCILYDALYKFDGCGAGGNLHILTDDNNTKDSCIEFLDKWLSECKDKTPKAQWAVERALLDLFKDFDEKDRDFILYGVDILCT